MIDERRPFHGASLVGILCLVGAATGCEATAPGAGPDTPASPPAPVEEGPSCTLEGAITKIVGADADINCGAGMFRGVCGEQCREHVRTCALESARGEKPFVAVWTNEMYDGVGTRRALLSRDDGNGKLAFIWLDFTYASAIDPISTTVSKNKRRIVARKCFELEDLNETCGGPAGSARKACQPAAARPDLWLRCASDDIPFCTSD